MFFKKKKKDEKPEVLSKENIVLNCHAKDSDDAIVQMGQLLLKAGFIQEGYIQGMLNRDHSLSTYLGNGVAIPHGEFEVADCVKKTGLGIMVFPEGVDWGKEKAYLVIGIAAKGDQHMEVLSNLAEKLIEPDDVQKLINGTQDYIYESLNQKS